MPVLKVPESLLCPIFKQLFKEPVVAQDGHTYELKAIKQWLDNKKRSPMTNKEMDDAKLTPNYLVKFIVSEFHDKHVSDQIFTEALFNEDTQFLQTCTYIQEQLCLVVPDQLVSRLQSLKWITERLTERLGKSVSLQKAFWKAVALPKGLAAVQYVHSVNPKLCTLQDEKGSGCLHHCASVEISKFLLKIGVPLMDHRYDAPISPLHCLNHFKTPLPVALHWLDQKEADLWSKDKGGNLPIFNLVSGFKHDEMTMGPIFDKMKFLMKDQEEKLLNYRNRDSLTLLEYAVSEGSTFSIRLVLKNYPQLLKAKITNSTNSNLVHLVAFRIGTEATQYMNVVCSETIQLLKKTDKTFLKSMVQAKDNNEMDPMEVVLQHLIQHDGGDAVEEHLDFVQVLLWEGASLSPLHKLLKGNIGVGDEVPAYLMPLVKLMCDQLFEPEQETFYQKRKRMETDEEKEKEEKNSSAEEAEEEEKPKPKKLKIK